MSSVLFNSGGTIAALLFRRVGDSLLATPALMALKNRYPESRLVVLCEPQVKRVFENVTCIDDILDTGPSPSPFRLTQKLRGLPDLAATIDFLSDPRSAIACAMSGAKVRVGFAKSLRRILYTHRIAEQDDSRPVYSAMHKVKLAEALDATSISWLPEFVIRDENRSIARKCFLTSNLRDNTTVAFFITSRREYKLWPLERFAEIVKIVMQTGNHSIAVIGSASERETIEEFCKTAGLPKQCSVVFTDIGDMGAFLSRCVLYVGNDGGPKHLAVAVGIPTVTVFQNDQWEYWTPPDRSRHVAFGGKAQSPSTDEVARAVLSLLGI